MITRPAVLSLFFLSLLGSTPSWADVSPEERAQTHKGEVEVGQTRFNLAGVSGTYQEVDARYASSIGGQWVAGGTLPLIRLNAQGRHTAGLGAPRIFGEYPIPGEAWSAFALGGRLDLPMGNKNAGLSSGRTALTPYARYEWRREALRLSALAGYRRSFTREDGKRVVFVDPHADNELIYRLEAGWKKPDSSVDSALFLDGENGRAKDGRGPGFLVGGFSMLFPVVDDYAVRFMAEHALTHPHRLENGLSLSFISRW